MNLFDPRLSLIAGLSLLEGFVLSSLKMRSLIAPSSKPNISGCLRVENDRSKPDSAAAKFTEEGFQFVQWLRRKVHSRPSVNSHFVSSAVIVLSLNWICNCTLKYL